MSKSELKRLSTLDPIGMAERLHELETQLAEKTKETFQWIDEALRLGELNARHVGEIKQLKVKALEAEKWKGIALAQDGDGRTVQQMEADIWKQVVVEWEKPWGLCNSESFEVRMRRRAAG